MNIFAIPMFFNHGLTVNGMAMLIAFLTKVTPTNASAVSYTQSVKVRHIRGKGVVEMYLIVYVYDHGEGNISHGAEAKTEQSTTDTWIDPVQALDHS